MHSLKLSDGRSLAFRVYGAGTPLYFFHGFPGCGLQAELIAEAAAAAGVSLVAADRPGFGRSSPAPRRSLLGWADDVAELADHLGHARFDILGISCGGPYALACAARMPKRLRYVGIVAGIGPMDVPSIRAGQLPLLRAMFAAARLSPWLVSPLLLLDRLMFRADPVRALEKLATLMTPPDRRLLAADPALRHRFALSLAEAYAGGIGGAMREAQLIGSAWGFELKHILVPVVIYQGGIDRNVPPAMGEYLASQIPRSRLRFYADEGHLSVLVNRISDCFADLLALR